MIEALDHIAVAVRDLDRAASAVVTAGPPQNGVGLPTPVTQGRIGQRPSGR